MLDRFVVPMVSSFRVLFPALFAPLKFQQSIVSLHVDVSRRSMGECDQVIWRLAQRVKARWLIDLTGGMIEVCAEKIRKHPRSLDHRVLQSKAAAPASPTASKLLCCVPAPLPMQFVQMEGVADGIADRLGELYPEAPVAVALIVAVPTEGLVDV
jgi:hypothetical protein